MLIFTCRFRYLECNARVHTLEQLTESLKAGQSMSRAEAEASAQLLGSESISDEQKCAFLKALADKGETAEEVSGFASVFRSLAIDPMVSDFAERGVDVCGTGGDGFGTFNISTTVSFLLAASGVPVLKHGNRSITSNCGSADLMEALGIRLEVELPVHRKALEALNFTFFFAPAFHPVFKAIMPARKALAAQGQKTIFNLLGPMINPARPKSQLMGVFSKDWLSPIADALQALNLRSGMIVHGEPLPGSRLDELSCAGVNYIQGFGSLSEESGVLDLASAGLASCEASELKGGSVSDNLALLKDFAEQKNRLMPQGLRDSIYLNAGAALYSAQQVNSIKEGVQRARETVQSGALEQWLEAIHAFYKDL